jgi:hypothetical protein
MPLTRCPGAETRLLRAAAQIGAPDNSQNAPRRYLRELAARRWREYAPLSTARISFQPPPTGLTRG